MIGDKVDGEETSPGSGAWLGPHLEKELDCKAGWVCHLGMHSEVQHLHIKVPELYMSSACFHLFAPANLKPHSHPPSSGMEVETQRVNTGYVNLARISLVPGSHSPKTCVFIVLILLSALSSQAGHK